MKCLVWIALSLPLFQLGVAADEGGAITLTPESAVAYALTNNFSLKSYTTGQQIADAVLTGEKAYWEPDFVAFVNQEENKRQNTTQEQLSMFTDVFEENNLETSLGIEGLLGSGAEYKVGYTVTDLANNLVNLTYSDKEPFESEYVSFAGITITQPLLKNRGFTVTRSKMKEAEYRQEIAVQEVRRQKMLTIAKTEVAFWNAWEMGQEVALRAQSIEIARTLVADNQERMNQGRMAEIEVEQAKVGVAQRERKWLAAKAKRNDAIRTLMGAMGRQMTGEQVILEQGVLGMLDFGEPDLDEMMGIAVQRHPDILISKKEIELSNLRLSVAKNQRWPQMDLFGSYGLNGLGDSYGDSFDTVQDGEYFSWSVGVMVNIPLGGGREAGAELRKAKLERRNVLDNFKSIEMDIANGVRTSLSQKQLLVQSLDALVQEVSINEMTLENEKVLLDSGKSTSRDVLEHEDDLSDSRIDMLKAKILLLKLMIQIDLSDGGMLARRGME